MAAQVFLVEDDDSIRMLLAVSLRGAGFSPVSFSNAQDALNVMEETRPDACILDIMMDGMNGLSLLEIMRKTPHLAKVPVMLLTAKDTEEEKIIGLDAGADDYMTKPFGVLELCARVRALLRRSGMQADDLPVLSALGLQVNLDSREIVLEDKVVPLTHKEFELLVYLMQNADKAVGREELLETIWGTGYVGESRTLDMHIGALRSKLEDDAEKPRFIKTVRGTGYRFVAPVTKERD